ncbi:MAG: hypothetical protein NVSMB32_03030 [Actinomycetota bacterium]
MKAASSSPETYIPGELGGVNRGSFCTARAQMGTPAAWYARTVLVRYPE